MPLDATNQEHAGIFGGTGWISPEGRDDTAAHFPEAHAVQRVATGPHQGLRRRTTTHAAYLDASDRHSGVTLGPWGVGPGTGEPVPPGATWAPCLMPEGPDPERHIAALLGYEGRREGQYDWRGREGEDEGEEADLRMPARLALPLPQAGAQSSGRASAAPFAALKQSHYT